MNTQPKQSKKKISLSKETLRNLSAPELRKACGATEGGGPTAQCTPTCGTTA
jgi:hypothetical protein